MLSVKKQQIHPTAIVDPTARIEENVTIGSYSVIGKCVHIKEGTDIASHTIIGDYTRIGIQCKIFSHAVIGSESQDLKYQGKVSFLEIGDHNIIREFVTINRATAEGGITRIGDHNLFMAYSHIAHDCQVGNHVVFANAVTLGGHVHIEDHVVIGAMTGVHQFVKVGKHAMVGAMSRICQDVPPFLLAVGCPPKIYGPNIIGLRRQGISSSSRKVLKQAYVIIYRKKLNFATICQQLDQLSSNEELDYLKSFILNSQRGICGFAT